MSRGLVSPAAPVASCRLRRTSPPARRHRPSPDRYADRPPAPSRASARGAAGSHDRPTGGYRRATRRSYTMTMILTASVAMFLLVYVVLTRWRSHERAELGLGRGRVV